MKLKLFTQQSCPRCPAAKEVVRKIENKVKVENYDIKTEDGLAEALNYNIMATPSIIITDMNNEIIAEWHGEAPSLDAINQVLK